MRYIIYTLLTISLSGCLSKTSNVKRSELGNEAANSAADRIYSNAVRPPITVQVDRNIVLDNRNIGR